MDRLWKMSGWLAREARFLDTNLELFKCINSGLI
jgi:hypothetical protein